MAADGDKRGWLRRTAVLVGVIVSIVLVGWVMVFWAPFLFVHENRYNRTTEEQSLEDKALSDVRANLLTATAGLAIIATGYFTWRRIGIEEDQADSARAQVRATEEGQITERYSRAIEQLGQQDQGGVSRMDIRIGGIYALERIALDAEARNVSDGPARDHVTVVEVLSRFIRTHIAEGRPPAPRRPAPSRDTIGQPKSTNDDDEDKVGWWYARADVDAALQVLGRQSPHIPARLSGLPGAGINLLRAKLKGASLVNANLRAANLRGADLRTANLRNAKLNGAQLLNTKLDGARLRGADLSNADLSGANLSGAELVRTKLEGISWNNRTQWPAGFQPPSPPDDQRQLEPSSGDGGDGEGADEHEVDGQQGEGHDEN